MDNISTYFIEPSITWFFKPWRYQNIDGKMSQRVHWKLPGSHNDKEHINGIQLPIQ